MSTKNDTYYFQPSTFLNQSFVPGTSQYYAIDKPSISRT